MIGIILSGHGHIASGFYSAIELILGKQEAFEIVDFPQEDTATELEAHAIEVLDKLKSCDEILVFTDLLSGSPFNTFSMKALQRKHMNVLYGTNLGMLIECIMKRNMDASLEELLTCAMETGRTQIGVFPVKQEDEEEEF